MPPINLKVLNLIKQEKRFIDLHLKIRPTSKPKLKKQTQIQKIILAQMKQRNFQQIKSEVAIEITVFSSEKNPPRIENFVKNLLDLMHKKELLENQDDFKFLPFIEDNMIRYLSAKYEFIAGEPSVFIRAKPFRTFISNLHFINENMDYKDDEDYKGNNDIEHSHRDYIDLLNNKEDYINSKVLDEKGYTSLLKMNKLSFQQNLTTNSRLTPNSIINFYPKKIIKYDFIRNNPNPSKIDKMYIDLQDLVDHNDNISNLLLHSAMKIKLEELPTQQNTKDEYKRNLEIRMKTYLEKREIFNDLLSPIFVTAYYTPPCNKRKTYKDIDNIMREYIIPTFNTIFNPPITYLNLDCDKMNAPKTLKNTSIGYEIIQLPKKKNINGLLGLSFSISNITDFNDGLVYNSNKKIREYIEKNYYDE